jgi:hypothetical protein
MLPKSFERSAGARVSSDRPLMKGIWHRLVMGLLLVAALVLIWYVLGSH